MVTTSNVIRELLENGVHFGHQTNKWNPKMGKYIFGEKSGIYIIDLRKTEEALLAAVDFVEKLAAETATDSCTSNDSPARTFRGALILLSPGIGLLAIGGHCLRPRLCRQGPILH